MNVRLHGLELASRANGPGVRAVVWFQGCTLACPGCFNPTSHDPAGGYEMNTDALARELLGAAGIEGVSISGGEPFQQPEALADLLGRLRGAVLSVLVFSGHTRAQILDLPLGQSLLSGIDVLVAGPYVHAERCGRGLLGSQNQQVHLLTSRYQPCDLSDLPRREAIVHRDGSITLSGVAPLAWPGPRGD